MVRGKKHIEMTVLAGGVVVFLSVLSLAAAGGAVAAAEEAVVATEGRFQNSETEPSFTYNPAQPPGYPGRRHTLPDTPHKIIPFETQSPTEHDLPHRPTPTRTTAPLVVVHSALRHPSSSAGFFVNRGEEESSSKDGLTDRPMLYPYPLDAIPKTQQPPCLLDLLRAPRVTSPLPKFAFSTDASQTGGAKEPQVVATATDGSRPGAQSGNLMHNHHPPHPYVSSSPSSSSSTSSPSPLDAESTNSHQGDVLYEVKEGISGTDTQHLKGATNQSEFRWPTTSGGKDESDSDVTLLPVATARKQINSSRDVLDNNGVYSDRKFSSEEKSSRVLCEVVESVLRSFSDWSSELGSLEKNLRGKSVLGARSGDHANRPISENAQLGHVQSQTTKSTAKYPSSATAASPDVESTPGGDLTATSKVAIRLYDEEGLVVERTLDPSVQYTVSVLAETGTIMALGIEDETGMGTDGLKPLSAHEEVINCSQSLLVSSTQTLVAQWRLTPGRQPRQVTFRAVCLQENNITPACYATATFAVNTAKVVRVKVDSPHGVVLVPAAHTAHIEVPYAHRITLKPLPASAVHHSNQSASFTPTKGSLRSGSRHTRSVEDGHNEEPDGGKKNEEGSKTSKEEEEDSRGCSSSFIEITDSLSTWVACPHHQETMTSLSSVVGVRADEAKSVGVEVESEGISEASRACGWGWVALDSHCYLLVEQKIMWSAAESSCVSQGGHLAAVTSPQVAQLINSFTMSSGKSDPNAAYWVGASDTQYENSFTWSSGAPFSYSEWFPGWSDQGGYNSQPSDDGLGEEDCVELRRTFRLATKGSRTTRNLYWNDRSCLAKNNYICEKPVPGGESEEENWWCNRSLNLLPHAPPTIVTSPGFPAHYPPALTCLTTLTAPTNAHLVVQFDKFVLEPHLQCNYDSLVLSEPGFNITTTRCGDWTSKLKLLRHVSRSNRLTLTFISDYAHNFPGFRARVSARTGSGCGDGREVRRGDMCYLLVSYPEVTWSTATHICRDMEGELARVGSEEVVRWIGTGLKNLPDYAAGALYWLGATLKPHTHRWTWQDGSLLNTSRMGHRVEGLQMTSQKETLCLSLQEMSASVPTHLPSLSLSAHHCGMFGGYVCSRRVPEPPTAKSIVVTGYGGNLTTPGYPSPYPNNLHLTITLRGPPSSRLVVTFSKIDLEYQQDCLYDYVGVQSGRQDHMIRYCGRHLKNMGRFDFVSKSNEAVLTLHSDWSVVGAGVMGRWRVVDMSSCPHQQLYQQQGVVTSPNFPYFNLNNIHCTTTIKASEGERIWLQFKVFEVGVQEPAIREEEEDSASSSSASDRSDGTGIAQELLSATLPPPFFVSSSSSSNFGNRRFARAISTSVDSPKITTNSIINGKNTENQRCQDDYVEVKLGEGAGESLRLCGALSEGEVQRLSYVSYSSTLRLVLHTSHRGRGKGFQASYLMGTKFAQRTVLQLGTSQPPKEEIGSDSVVSGDESAVALGGVHALNFPLAPAPGVTLTHQLLAPPGHQLHLRIHNIGVLATPEKSCQQDYVEVEDWYAGRNGTTWKICSVDRSSRHEISIRSIFNSLILREVHLDPLDLIRKHSEPPTEQKTSPSSSPSSSSSSSSSNSSSSSSLSSSKSKRSSGSSFVHSRAPRSYFKGLESASQRFISLSIIDALSSSSDTLKSNPTQEPEASSSSVFPSPADDVDTSTPTSRAKSPNSIISPSGSHSGHHVSPTSLPSPPSPSLPSNSIPNRSHWSSSVAYFSATYEVHRDPSWLNRTMGVGVDGMGVRTTGVAWCDPSPCLNNGRCITQGENHTCLCTPSYTGAFCQMTWCEMSPCVWGHCQPGGPDGYVCVCEKGYGGPRCRDRVSPCDNDPCQSRGVCTAVNYTFHCQCHAWWEGSRCERRMRRIPFKPLSERMFEEPFWLGLMTVAIVMACIGIVFCIKKHFAEKIEKFFAEEIERSKYGAMSPAPSRLAPLPSPTGLSPRPRPKSLFVRLNSFRKASLLSLSSTASSPQCEAPAFTFDDLLKLHKRGSAASSSSSPRRSQHKCRSQTASPRVDNKKILRHLVTPPVGHRASSFDELLHLHTQTPKCSVERTRSTDIATELRRSDGGDSSSALIEGLIHETSLTSLVPSPSKHDKKVTFAKLLDKMSKEISSSSSDISCAEEKSPSRMFNLGGARRSPRRSPRIRHTQRYSGSGSEDVAETPDVSSSEMTPDPPKRLLSVKCSSSPSSKTSSPQSRNKMVKISSADSLLAMFRNFGGSGRTSASSNPSSPHGSELEDSSAHQSPSTTPTTPQKAPPPVKQDTLTVPGALQVQVQSGCGGGSVQHGGPVITLEVPSNDQYRCLSPITELPTPVPTPVPSPLPTPCRIRPKPRTSSESNDNKESEDTESEFSLSMSAERSSSDSSGPDHRIFFTSLKSLSAIHDTSNRSETLSPTGATVTPSSTFSSRTPSPVTSPTVSPATSPKVKTRPPPLHIPNANVLKFSVDKGEGSSDGACGGITLQVPVIKVEDTDKEMPWDSTPRNRSQSVDVGSILQAPLITVSPADDDPPTPPAQPPPLVIPTLNVTLASPPVFRKNYPPVPTIKIDEPDSRKPPIPPRRNPPLKREKASSLDLQQAPSITVTSMLSEVESDTDSPTTGCRQGGPASSYLSPFLGVELRASESNLSSSGYSSAYSPGPSRCSSDNPLCMDEPLTPSVSSIPARPMHFPGPVPAIMVPPRNKRRPMLKTPPSETTTIIAPSPLLRTDSETTDDPGASQPEADSALEIDTNDECSDGVMHTEQMEKLTSADEAEAQRQRLLLSSSHSFPKESPRLVRSPPAIVVHSSLPSESSLEDCLTEKPSRLSPVSSRSESPISDSRLSVARIYPAFFGVSGKPELPYTDSDGLYDCPSSEVLHSDSHASVSPLKRLGKKKLKRSSGKGIKSLLGLNSVGSGEIGSGTGTLSDGAKSRLEPPNWERSPRRHSPKRRVRAQTSVDLLSSSNESITSQSPVGSSSSPGENGGVQTDTEASRDGSGSMAGQRGRRRRPLLRGNSIQTKYLPRQGSIDASGEETQEEQLMLKPSRVTDELPRHRKISRFRNFGNQIRAAEVWMSHCRFLRRLQLSKGAKDHLVSPVGSSDSDPECGPPDGPTRAGPSTKHGSGSSSTKGTVLTTKDSRSQVKYKPVSGGSCTVRSFSS